MDMVEDANSYFPIEIVAHNGEKQVCNTPEDVPEGVSFRVVDTNVKSKSKLINTGVPNVWSASLE